MNHRIAFAAAALGLLAAGCVGVSVNRSESSSTRRAAGSADAAVKLLAVDVEFARLAAERGPAEAFARYCDAASMRVTPAGPNTVGPAAFQTELEKMAAGSLTWTPRSAEVSSGGDMGWTWGDYLMRGEKGERRGRYVTVWRWRGSQWWIAADIGTEASP